MFFLVPSSTETLLKRAFPSQRATLETLLFSKEVLDAPQLQDDFYLTLGTEDSWIRTQWKFNSSIGG